MKRRQSFYYFLLLIQRLFNEQINTFETGKKKKPWNDSGDFVWSIASAFFLYHRIIPRATTF